ncbi:hypothetical protein HDV05_006631, partial [Chytridiales sp. JEL 0842]
MLSPTLLLSLTALLSISTFTSAQGSTYSCTPANCRPADGCFCASRDPPGGLNLQDVPMFVTLTLDDAVQERLYDAFNTPFQSGYRNPNGCPLPATYFISLPYTNYHTATRLYAQGNEIALHTFNHADLATNTTQGVNQEVVNNLITLSTLAGVPTREIIGFRHPFLSHNQNTFKAIAETRAIRYESSVTVDDRVNGFWPFTLDHGLPFTARCPGCSPDNSQWINPGMWEIPMYTLLTPSGDIWATMDPDMDPIKNNWAQALDYLKSNFERHYAKKLPFGLYQHAAQFIAWGPEAQQRKTEVIREFIEWTQTFPGVWY